MRRLLVLTFAVFLAACADGPLDPQDRERELAGTYWAESVEGNPIPHWSHSMLSAELELRRDGTFSEWWFLEDDTWEYHGRWRLVSDQIRLTTNGELLENGWVYGRRLELEESGIVYVKDRDYY